MNNPDAQYYSNMCSTTATGVRETESNIQIVDKIDERFLLRIESDVQ